MLRLLLLSVAVDTVGPVSEVNGASSVLPCTCRAFSAVLLPLAKRSASGCHDLGTSAERVLLSGSLGHRYKEEKGPASVSRTGVGRVCYAQSGVSIGQLAPSG